MTGKADGPRSFDPEQFAVRLKQARTVVLAYAIKRLASISDRGVYEVSGSAHTYLVVLDLSGQIAHFCSCSDGRALIAVSGGASSLCKHVLACILKNGPKQLLMPLLCQKSKSGSRL